MINNSKMVFFGSSEFSVYVLEELLLHGIKPSLIVTTPDKPKGRKLIMTPNPCKVWANEHGVEVIDPASLKKDNEALIYNLKSKNYDLFLVASYGKIIPKEIFEIPGKQTLNIHPSLLPKYRGASPIQSQILNNEKEVGVSIMVISEGMDEGPVVVKKILPHHKNFDRSSLKGSHTTQSFHDASGEGNQEFLEPQGFGRLARLTEPSTRNFSAEKYPCSQNLEAEKIPNAKEKQNENLDYSPLKGSHADQNFHFVFLGRIELEKILAREGAGLFAHILPEWMQGAIDPIMQNEAEATYCKKIEKEDGLLDLNDDPYKNYLKIKALEGWPGTYFFIDGKRVIIKEAEFKDGKLEILKVIPEGKKEMLYSDFLRGQK